MLTSRVRNPVRLVAFLHFNPLKCNPLKHADKPEVWLFVPSEFSTELGNEVFQQYVILGIYDLHYQTYSLSIKVRKRVVRNLKKHGPFSIWSGSRVLDF